MTDEIRVGEDGWDEPDDYPDLDLDDYPDGTDHVLVAMYRTITEDHEQASLEEIQVYIEGVFGLDIDYHWVNYRIERLLEEGHIVYWPIERSDPTDTRKHYRLKAHTEQLAAALSEADSILGEVTRDFDDEDVLEILKHVSRLRRSGDLTEEEQSLGTVVDRLADLEDQVSRLDETTDVLHDKADKAFAKADSASSKLRAEKGICGICSREGILVKQLPAGIKICADCADD